MTRVEVRWYGDEVNATVDAALARGVGTSLRDVAETSDDRVPVQTTELKRSRGTSQDGTSGTVYYTDNKAAVAHENPRKHRYRNGKREKYLESALNESGDRFVQNLAGELREVL